MRSLWQSSALSLLNAEAAATHQEDAKAKVKNPAKDPVVDVDPNREEARNLNPARNREASLVDYLEEETIPEVMKNPRIQAPNRDAVAAASYAKCLTDLEDDAATPQGLRATEGAVVTVEGTCWVVTAALVHDVCAGVLVGLTHFFQG